MKNLHKLNHYRDTEFELQMYGRSGDSKGGVFRMKFNGQPLAVIASVGEGWDHVSVSCPDRIPTWDEMEYIKRRFFEDDETAMQLHVPPGEHIDCCRNCLHLWRPLDVDIPRPPPIMVGPS